MPTRSSLLSKAIVRLAFGVVLLVLVPACGSSAKPASLSTPQLATTAKLPAPPAELGNGLVCGAAADRVLNIPDRIDLREFTKGSARPRSTAIQQALALYLADHSDSITRQRAAGLIVGQCAAYGFYIITYHECLGSTAPGRIASIDTIRACIDRRKWTVYTQQ